MRLFWGLHNIVFHITEVNSSYQTGPREYRQIPYIEGMTDRDIIFIFWGHDYLCGFGTVHRLGRPYQHEGRVVRDISVDPRFSSSPIAQLSDIRANPLFANYSSISWELSYFTREQATYLSQLCEQHRLRPPYPEPDDIPEGWERVDQQEGRRGNQGAVVKVRSRSDGQFGALKRLHEAHLVNTERRYRMANEVNALRVLSGRGTPAVLYSDTEYWNTSGVPLCLIMEWIEGPTLSQYVQRALMSLNNALETTNALLSALDSCHQLDIYHRDLKPDNIILRVSDHADPVIVDFGMAWSRPPEASLTEFRTEAGQELGNRFLRLPEYAANRHQFDARSDITLLVGLLFFMITGRAPRQLIDAESRMPHETLASSIPMRILDEPGWPILERLFNMGFQQSINNRFQSSTQLREQIELIQLAQTRVTR